MTNSTLFSSEDNLSEHFEAARRVDAKDYKPKDLGKLIQEYCEQEGQPLVVSNIDQLNRWNDDDFTLDQLKNHRGDMDIIMSNEDKTTIKLGDIIDALKIKYNLGENNLTNDNTAAMNIDNLYAKDISCPDQFKTALTQALPKYLLPHSYSDLFSLLPERFQAENLMCYVGQCNTGTAIHRDLCGTMGHNVMITASPDAFAEWYIVQNDQREELASILKPSNQDIQIHLLESQQDNDARSNNTKTSFLESDRAWLLPEKLENTNLKVQVIVQRKGDLVVVPSRAYHQVRNSGVSIKIAWNRITPDTLKYAFEDQLPLYRIINRPEVYKCKAIVAFAIQEWYKQMQSLDDLVQRRLDEKVNVPPAFKVLKDFSRNSHTLLDIYLKEVIAPELLYGDHNEDIITDGPGEVCTIICDFCHSDIFHRYYHCSSCKGYDICLNCYSMGRSCKHITKMKMHQSPDDIMRHVDAYRNYVQLFNEKFGKIAWIKPDLEQALLEINQSDANNLATICRRLEAYKRAKPHSFNTLICSHCSSKFKVKHLCERGYGLSSIFSRDVCPKINIKEENDKFLKIFACKQCSTKCNKCKPLISDKASLDNYALVYYLHPSHDERNLGGFIDLNMKKTSDFPFTNLYYPPAPVDHGKNLRKRKLVDYRALAGIDEEYQVQDSNDQDNNNLDRNNQDIDVRDRDDLSSKKQKTVA